MANRLNVQNIYASDSDTTAAVQVSGANVTLNGTANDLGTVTAGTFNGTIGDSATFPSGKIIWVENGITTGESGTTTNSTSFTTLSNQMKVNITASNAGLCSKIIVMFHTSINISTGSAQTRINARIARVRNGVTDDLMNGTLWYAGTDGTGTAIWATPTIIVTDTSPNGTHDHSYEFQVRKGGASSTQSGSITPNHAGMHYLIMGVK